MCCSSTVFIFLFCGCAQTVFCFVTEPLFPQSNSFSGCWHEYIYICKKERDELLANPCLYHVRPLTHTSDFRRPKSTTRAQKFCLCSVPPLCQLHHSSILCDALRWWRCIVVNAVTVSLVVMDGVPQSFPDCHTLYKEHVSNCFDIRSHEFQLSYLWCFFSSRHRRSQLRQWNPPNRNIKRFCSISASLGLIT